MILVLSCEDIHHNENGKSAYIYCMGLIHWIIYDDVTATALETTQEWPMQVGDFLLLSIIHPVILDLPDVLNSILYEPRSIYTFSFGNCGMTQHYIT